MMSIRLTTSEYRGAYAALMILKMLHDLSEESPAGSWVKHGEKQAYYDGMLACKQAALIENFDILDLAVVVRGIRLSFDDIPARIKPRFYRDQSRKA